MKIKFKKKATEYSVFFMMVIIIVIMTIIVRLYTKYHSFEDVIGTSAFKIMNTYENVEKFQYYLDYSLSKAFLESLFKGAETGFAYDCQNDYYGYKIINQNCGPSLNKIKQNIDFKKYYDLYSKQLSYPEFNFYFVENKNGFSLIAKSKEKLLAEINPEPKGKCCALVSTFTTNYFTIDDGSCSDLNPLIIGDSMPSVNYVDVDKEYCSGKEISIKLESSVLLNKNENNEDDNNLVDYKQNDGINENEMCSYCGVNRDLVNNYYPNKYEDCKTNICCSAPCPPRTKKLDFPYYAQCSFGSDACRAACGPISLKMALDGFHNTNYYLKDIWNGVGSYGSYTYPTNIPNYANSYKGINAYCISDISFESLKRYINQGSPVILLIHMPLYNSETARINSNAWHFFLVTGYSENELIVHEPYPSPGSLYSSLFKFGKYLVIKRSTYENKIYPSSLSYSSCPGVVISYNKNQNTLVENEI